METIRKWKQTNKTSNTCTGDKGKQTNKQTMGGGTCRGVDAGGGVELHNMQSPICSVSEYVEEVWRCIGDESEKCSVGGIIIRHMNHLWSPVQGQDELS